MHVMLESNKSAKPSAFGTTCRSEAEESEYRMIYTSTGGNEFNDMSFMPNRTEKMRCLYSKKRRDTHLFSCLFPLHVPSFFAPMKTDS